MKAITGLCLLLIQTACAVSGQAAREQRVPTEMPPAPPAQPTATPPLASSVLLAQWNASQNRREIRPVDPATGQAVPGYPPIGLGGDSQYVSPHILSADGRQLAAVESIGTSCESYAGGTSCRASADVLHLVDLRAWREVTATLPARGWVWPLSFSPDSTRLALAHHEQATSTLVVFDAGTGQAIARRVLPFRPSLIEYAPAGDTLVVYGTPLGSVPGMTKPDPPRVLLVDPTTLEIRWDQSLTNILSGEWCLENCDASHEQQSFVYWTPAVVLAHDGRRLFVVHADEEKLTTVDFDARAVRSVDIEAAQSWLEQFLALTTDVAQAKGVTRGAFKAAALSPDGKQLYVVGRTMDTAHETSGDGQAAEVSLGLQVVEVESGRKVAGRDSEAARIRLSPDGVHLLLDVWGGPWTEVLDAQSLRSVARLSQWEVVNTRRIDGRPIVLASQPTQRSTPLAMLDPRTFDVVHAWSADTYAAWVATP